jgi:hypothetical protein
MDGASCIECCISFMGVVVGRCDMVTHRRTQTDTCGNIRTSDPCVTSLPVLNSEPLP